MPTRGHGVIVRAVGEPGRVEEIVLDDPGPGEVLVRLRASGVCHTDLLYKQGRNSSFPYLLGHEGAGVVEHVGPGVTRPAVGDSVILAWRAPCGDCRFCLTGRPHWCIASLTAPNRIRDSTGGVLTPTLGLGTFCTHTVVAARQAITVPSDLPAEQMCLLGCAVMTGVGAALYTAAVVPGASVAVFGCGGVGTSVIQGARLAGATIIIGVDVASDKLRWAQELGATHVVDARAGDVVAHIREITGGNGVNYAFEAVGQPNTLDQALWCRDQRGTCVMIGGQQADSTVTLPLDRFMRLRGPLKVSIYGDCLPARDFPLLVDWYRSGRLRLDELVTRTISLDETEEAFDAMERGETLRTEPPRVWWRLQSLRGWSHDTSHTVPARAAGAGHAPGAGAPCRAPIGLGGHPVDRREAGDDPGDVAEVAAAGRGRSRPAAGCHQQ
jgi:S-(hydroxymethyl)mycothiol dehydrogenase